MQFVVGENSTIGVYMPYIVQKPDDYRNIYTIHLENVQVFDWIRYPMLDAWTSYGTSHPMPVFRLTIQFVVSLGVQRTL